ncbi:MAG: hypothetical protein AUK44_03150 [Porphyromonadaceae bacterium CG2_30_38_12]|nr:MAG: hypothetical protein AUK44_03150 [Porphyromonadaceae bacterium CG2_30_38_12]
MSKDKVSSHEMVEMVAAKLSVNKSVAEEFLKSLFAEIEQNLLNGEPVKIKDLGTFKLQWNEPRKSVNVQTGEVFTIEGYNKVVFIPEADLKQQVNEPFAHLEAITLEQNTIPVTEIEPENPEKLDSLRNITEQATEIKDILLEIKALSRQHENSQSEHTTIETNNEIEIELPKPDTELESEPAIEPNTDTNLITEQTQAPLQIPDYDLILLDEEADVQGETTEKQVTILAEKEPEFATQLVPEPTEPTSIEPEIEDIPETAPVMEPQMEPQLEYEKYKEPEIEPKIENQPITEPDYDSNTNSINDNSSNTGHPMLENKKTKKHKKGKFWLVLFIIIIVLSGAWSAVYFSSSCVQCWFQYTVMSEENKQRVSEIELQVGSWFQNIFSKEKPAAKIVAPKTTALAPVVKVANDSIAADSTTTPNSENAQTVINEKADALQKIFDKPREYTKFIGSEQVKEGTRLMNISLKYYKHKDFWIYIYEANGETIVHPDRLKAGSIIQIPQVDARLINPRDPRCIKYAKELQKIYIGKE